MKHSILKSSVRFGVTAGALSLMTGVLFAADPTPQDQVKNAVTALAAKGSYSWTTTVNNANAAGAGGRGRFRTGPVEGKTVKGGLTFLTMTRGDNTTEVVLQGDKAAIKGAAGWQTLAEATATDTGQPNPTRFIARMVQTFKTPAAEAADLASKAQALTKTEDAFTAELTEADAQQLLTTGPRPGGGNAPAPTNAKGSVKFVVKDGVLSRYEYNVQGTMNFNGNDVNINRTTTTEIKDIDTTKVDVPDEAKQKVS